MLKDLPRARGSECRIRLLAAFIRSRDVLSWDRTKVKVAGFSPLPHPTHGV